MKKALVFVIACILATFGPTMVYAAEKAPKMIVDFVYSNLVALGTHPIIVKAVKAENAKGKTLAQIKEMDKKWLATPGHADYMTALMDSECGKFLRSIQNRAPYYAEIFVMDNQGANVAMTKKTTDYWQGDEAKFIESYKEGKGGIYIGDIKFDDSTRAYLGHLSVPVKDGDKVIGVVTFGIDVEKFKITKQE